MATEDNHQYLDSNVSHQEESEPAGPESLAGRRGGAGDAGDAGTGTGTGAGAGVCACASGIRGSGSGSEAHAEAGACVGADIGITAAALGLSSVVGSSTDGDSPLLPLSSEEPAAVSSISPEQLRPDPQLISGLLRLAGKAADPERRRRALSAAVQGEPYTPNDLPELQAMVVGICRVLVKSGVPADALCELIMDATLE